MAIRTICNRCNCTGRIKKEGRKRPAICPDCEGVGFKMLSKEMQPETVVLVVLIVSIFTIGVLVGIAL